MSHVTRSRPDGRLILLLGALAACGPISIDMYLPSLPTISQAFAISNGAAQTTLTSFMFGFSIGMLLYGPLSDTYGRRPVLLGGIIMYAVARAKAMAKAKTTLPRADRVRAVSTRSTPPSLTMRHLPRSSFDQPLQRDVR